MATKPSPTVTVGNVRFGNALPFALIAGPCALESRAHAFDMASALKDITAQARHRLRLQNLVRQGEPHQREERARHRARQGAADLRRTAGKTRRAGAHRRARARPVRAGRRSRRHSADPGVPVPADRPAGRRRKDRPRGQRQEGPVPRALGHGECRREDHGRRQPQCARHRARRLVRLQHAGLRHARAADARHRPARR